MILLQVSVCTGGQLFVFWNCSVAVADCESADWISYWPYKENIRITESFILIYTPEPSCCAGPRSLLVKSFLYSQRIKCPLPPTRISKAEHEAVKYWIRSVLNVVAMPTVCELIMPCRMGGGMEKTRNDFPMSQDLKWICQARSSSFSPIHIVTERSR